MDINLKEKMMSEDINKNSISEDINKITDKLLSRCYVLEGKTPRRCELIEEYVQFDRPNLKRVARSHRCGSTVSTVFLMHDHNWHADGLPILFETMVFGGDMDGYHERYSSYDDAIEGHKRICEMVEGQELFCLTALADDK